MKAALQKLESRVAVLEKAPAPAAVPCAKVGDKEHEHMLNLGDCPDLFVFTTKKTLFLPGRTSETGGKRRRR